MNRHRNLYLLPLLAGWVILLLGDCAAMAGQAGPQNGTMFVVLLSTLVLACMITAAVMVIVERWPR
ncbi:hypothetical protein SAMN05444920_12014 [Nonomuraea solani]|uniref:Uncharacterized protein n=1 Tax=Nonomuraea solani TaxID=1144553 RepID=A0A1H6ETW7_9ACTN|nr:hypothetical protein [Nonomuraea solani]SEH01310.1 hypothetical protein SAMN05444920_12014 [Nonomuraea solani]